MICIGGDDRMRFVKDIKKYWTYAIYSAKAELKSEVASSYLNWLWWILDPLLFMLVYTFIAEIVFKRSEPYFPVFVLIGLTMWSFFDKIILGSVKIVKNNHAIVSKVYVPKFILIMQKMMVNGFKMLISFGLIALMMAAFRVPPTYKIVYIVPLLVVLLIVTFAIGNLMLHFGVFVEDLFNVMKVVLKLAFYMTGIFFSIENRVPAPYNELLLKLNPIAFLIDSGRECMLYGRTPDFRLLLAWGAGGVLLSVVALKVVYKYENSYVKVI